MIKRILGSIVALLVVAFIVIWALGGGIQKIEVAVNHYRDPLKYGSIYDWFFQIGSTTGESFKLPGTPSSYPTVSMPTGTATTSVGPTTIYESGSNGGQGTGQ
jgi:hypothetical protein